MPFVLASSRAASRAAPHPPSAVPGHFGCGARMGSGLPISMVPRSRRHARSGRLSMAVATTPCSPNFAEGPSDRTIWELPPARGPHSTAFLIPALPSSRGCLNWLFNYNALFSPGSLMVRSPLFVLSGVMRFLGKIRPPPTLRAVLSPFGGGGWVGSGLPFPVVPRSRRWVRCGRLSIAVATTP